MTKSKKTDKPRRTAKAARRAPKAAPEERKPYPDDLGLRWLYQSVPQDEAAEGEDHIGRLRLKNHPFGGHR